MIIEGEDPQYWDNYRKFIRLYNTPEITVEVIKQDLDLKDSKYRQYLKRGKEEGVIELRANRNQKGWKHLPVMVRVARYENVLRYLRFSGRVNSGNREFIEDMIVNVIKENPELDVYDLCDKCVSILDGSDVL